VTQEELDEIVRKNDSTWIAMNDIIRLTEEVARLNNIIGNAEAMENLLHDVDCGLIFIQAVLPHDANPSTDAARKKVEELRYSVLSLIDPESIIEQGENEP
jgi:hypothetical protein